MRALVLALPLLLLFAAPAGAFRCERTRTGPPVTAVLIDPYPGTSVHACDHRTGRSRRLAHGRLTGRKRPVGTEIDDVDVDGRRVAWTYSRIERRHATILLREAVVGRRVRIVARRTLYDGPRLKYIGATVAVSARGDLAWSRDKVVLKPVGGAARVVGAGWVDGFEDGRTLRWVGARDETRHYLDLRPLPQRDGCPARKGWTPLGASDRVLVTQAFYGPIEQAQYQVVRVCLRGSGEDHVVAQSGPAIQYNATNDYGVASFDGHWVVLYHASSAKQEGSVELGVVDAATGTVGRWAMLGAWDGNTYFDSRVDAPGVVVTERGVPAWITSDQTTSRLVTIDSGIKVLDRGPVGSLANLRSDGPRVTWTNAGEPKSADLG